jgi:hypothetical protein
MYKALEQKNSDEKNVTLKVSLTSVAKKDPDHVPVPIHSGVIRSMPETVFMRVTALFRPVLYSSFGELVSKFRIPKSQNQISRDIPRPAKMVDERHTTDADDR